MGNKKLVRSKFREVVFSRDNYKCKICGSATNLDAHHIINRNHIAKGGYVSQNGITLCKICHPLAEAAWDSFLLGEKAMELTGFFPDDLFSLIDSNEQIAKNKAESELE